MQKYHKIDTLFERDPVTKKLVETVYRNEVVGYLKRCQWRFSEKIDGTNIRIGWDGYKVTIGGRTDNAQIPAKLMQFLADTFLGEANAQIFEQKFNQGRFTLPEVTLFGEGFGAGIQNGGNYQQEQTFILFDVLLGDIWLPREAVGIVARYFNLLVVPEWYGTIAEGVEYIKNAPPSYFGGGKMEGVVVRPMVEMFDRLGRRVIFKLKVTDFD